jgi:hypothetical protein
MLQFKNGTPFKGTIALAPDPDGIDSLSAVVKGTFALGPEPRIADEQVPLALKDEYHGEPGKSSIRTASDLSLVKPGTDVLLAGTGYAPDGRAVSQFDVTLKVGPVNKTVRVIGDRAWEEKLLGAAAGKPEPVAKVPLVWERAFGGSDETASEPPALHAEPRNPVGAGFRHKDGKKKLAGLKLPNLEDPRALISSWRDRPAPAAFGPVCPFWEPRRSYAGTYDEAWQKGRAPYLPKDFDPRFSQLAPPDQVVPGYLKGGEPVEVTNATSSGTLRFHLPNVRLQVTYRLGGAGHVRPANLDTVLIEPDRGRLILVWRTVFPCDKKALQVQSIEVAFAPGGGGG